MPLRREFKVQGLHNREEMRNEAILTVWYSSGCRAELNCRIAAAFASASKLPVPLH
jgi:hypothetical protein